MKSIPVAAPEQLLTPAEVCSILRVSRRTLRRWCAGKRPKLTYIQLSPNSIRFRRQLIEWFIETHEVDEAADDAEAQATTDLAGKRTADLVLLTSARQRIATSLGRLSA